MARKIILFLVTWTNLTLFVLVTGVKNKSSENRKIEGIAYKKNVGNSSVLESLKSFYEESRNPRAADDKNFFLSSRRYNETAQLTFPLLSFQLPQHGPEGSSLNFMNQAIMGLFALFIYAVHFAPLVFKGDGIKDSTARNLGDGHFHLFQSNKPFNMDFGSSSKGIKKYTGLDGEKCLQKAICEAHQNPKQYGLISLPFRLIFNPTIHKTAKEQYSSYEMAARDGKCSRRTSCSEKYNCFFDVLDLLNYYFNWWNFNDDPNFIQINHDDTFK